MLNSFTSAYASLRPSPSALPAFAARVAAPLGDWMRQRREMRRIVAELETYTPRQLCELGLTRGDILDVARGTFARR